MSAETHLAKFGVTFQQASDFIFANVDRPQVIFDTANEFAVTTEMLSEITQFSTDIIRDFFADFGLDTSQLEDTHILISTDPDTLSGLVAFNERIGALSNESLRSVVQDALLQSSIDATAYDNVFGPQLDFQDDDGIYDADELGVEGLGNVPATTASVESLFYGSLINMFSRFDSFELNQIIPISLDNRFISEDFQAFVLEALTDIPETPRQTEDELAELAGLVAREAAILISEMAQDNTIVGVLDQSYLGVAVA